MKKKFGQSVMGAVAVMLAVQTVPNSGLLISSAMAQDAMVAKSVTKVRSIDKVELIKTAYINFQTTIDLGTLKADGTKMTAKDAIDQFTLELIENNVTEHDMADFVKQNAKDTETYDKYINGVEEAKKNLKGDDFTPEEFGVMAGVSLGMMDEEELKWSGCAGLGIGIVLIIGAVTMGIIALVKSEGEQSIRSKFAARKRNRQTDYANDVAYINNAENRIQGEIIQAQGQIDQINESIDQAQSDISYWTGVLDGANLSNGGEGDPVLSAEASGNISSLLNQIEDLQADIVSVQTDIQGMMAELDNYNDPRYKEGLLQAELDRFEIDIANLENELQNKVDLVPVNQRRAKHLGIAAGVSGAIGIYLTIDGKQSC